MNLIDIAKILTSVRAALEGMEVRAGRANAYRLVASMDDIDHIIDAINKGEVDTHADVHTDAQSRPT